MQSLQNSRRGNTACDLLLDFDFSLLVRPIYFHKLPEYSKNLYIMARVLVGVKRVIDYAVKVSILPSNMQKKNKRQQKCKGYIALTAIFPSRYV